MIDYSDTEARLREFLKENLKESRLEHTYSVKEEAAKLAAAYGADVSKAELAALFHDAYRNLPPQAMDMYINTLGIPARYKGNPNLAHSKIAAAAMKQVYDIDDQELIDAVSYHTTGRAGMSLLEKVLFIADAIEPGRHYPGVDEIRQAAYVDLDKACRLSLEGTVRFLKSKDAFIDQDTVDALKYLKEKDHL